MPAVAAVRRDAAAQMAWLQFGNLTDVALVPMAFKGVTIHFWVVTSEESAAINVVARRAWGRVSRLKSASRLHVLAVLHSKSILVRAGGSVLLPSAVPRAF